MTLYIDHTVVASVMKSYTLSVHHMQNLRPHPTPCHCQASHSMPIHLSCASRYMPAAPLQQALSYLHSLLPRLAPRRTKVLTYTFCKHSREHASVL